MPAILKIGLSRKVSENYNSEGYSIDLQTELPQAAVDNPEEMARNTAYLFGLAEDLLAEQVSKRQGAGKPQSVEVPRPTAQRQPVATNGQITDRRTYPSRNGEGRTRPSASNGNGQGGQVRLATAAQVSAIEKMARRAKQDPHQLSVDDFGVALKELTLRQASDLIDNLKGMIEGGQPQGAAR